MPLRVPRLQRKGFNLQLLRVGIAWCMRCTEGYTIDVCLMYIILSINLLRYHCVVPNQYDQAPRHLRLPCRHRKRPLTNALSAALPRNPVDVAVALEVVLGSRIVEMLGTHCLTIHGSRASRLAKVCFQEGQIWHPLCVCRSLCVCVCMCVCRAYERMS